MQLVQEMEIDRETIKLMKDPTQMLATLELERILNITYNKSEKMFHSLIQQHLVLWNNLEGSSRI